MTIELRRKHRIIGVTVFLVVSLAFALWIGSGTTNQMSREDILRRARLFVAEGKTSDAEKLVRQAIDGEPGPSTVYCFAAQLAMQQQNYEQALDDLSRVQKQDTNEWLLARRLTAEIFHKHVHRFRDAERAYLDVLDSNASETVALEGYAQLLGLCGRRSEAIPYVLRLIKSGYDTDLLMLLSRESGALNDPELLEAAHRSAPGDPNPLIGQARAAELQQNPELALRRLQQASNLKELPATFHGLLGKQLLACEAFTELDAWLQNVSDKSTSADEWIVRAALADREQDINGAIRCYWEAVKLRPESLSAVNQLARQLTLDGHPHLAQPFEKRVAEINDLRTRQQVAILSDRPPSLPDVRKMIDGLESVGRYWEAFAWGQAALVMAPPQSDLANQVTSLKSRIDQLPLVMTAPKNNPAFAVDLSHYSLPTHQRSGSRHQQASVSKNISFMKQTTEIGFDFTFFQGSTVPTHRMTEIGGGGIAAFDFDNDTAPDMYCTQGMAASGAATSNSDRYRDRLFRNHGGQSFFEVSATAFASHESGYGQGVATGDVNNDGFQDIYVANTQENMLWLNNGDGTFSRPTPTLNAPVREWTTSCLIADINGDSFPDLYDVNYLSGTDVFVRTCEEEHGDRIMCAPHDFEPAEDRIWLGNGMGDFADATPQYLSPAPDGKGLGIVAMRGPHRQLSLFIANDTTANFLYAAASEDATRLIETAMTAGVAFNGDGKAEACMGIAAGDCTRDGKLDLFVTNFLRESNTLYCPVSDRLYQDETRTLGLHEPSLSKLGFGTQFLDANCDGRLELFVTNGYTQDLSKYGTPYSMTPQIFEWTGARFQQIPSDKPGAWIETKVVGRAAARLDWNLDGKPDLAVGLLESPSQLLTNTSETNANHFFSMQLIAKNSARDAIGASVTVTVDGAIQVHQLTAGDGYQCSNERRLQIGCGQASSIDLQVEWPSGTVQRFANVKTSTRVVLIEGRSIAEIPR